MSQRRRLRKIPTDSSSGPSGEGCREQQLRQVFLIFFIERAKRAPHWGVQSRFRVINMYVGMYVCRGPKSVGGNTWAKRAHAQSQYCAVKSDQ